jgi:hypothetical protein
MNKKRVLLFIVFIIISCLLSFNINEKEESEKWFPFQPSNTFQSGEIGMEAWLDAPAGKHGFVKNEGDQLVFENGQSVKFWGTNLCTRLPYVEAEKADSFVSLAAKYGMNAIRFHKFSWFGYSKDKSTEFDPEKFERFDYFQSRLREKGIYYGWSHIYGHRVLPGDSSRLVAYSEIKNLEYPWSHLNGSTASLVNFAPDLQQLSIDLTLNMLNHVNAHTGLRYAEDPGLAFIEFQNEDNIFWGAIEYALEQAPTYRKMLCEQFSTWLFGKYESQSELKKAWGEDNIPEEESISRRNIYPQPNHGLFSYEYETALKESRPMATHILDKMRFLYEKQVEFYKRFEEAVRETGYKGVLVASCWQAGSGISHFYNLHADYLVGMIDRHNYFGGGEGGHGLQTGSVKNESMISEPGSGLFSAGMQQVVDRPFAFSEWMSLIPNQWTAEAAPIIAVYGMGLQGWDASFSFATDIPRFSPFLQSEHHGVYNVTSPLHMGLYPALARMIYRNDMQESPVIFTRNVHVPSLEEGVLDFEEKVDQGFDDKRFTGSVSPRTLAVGRIPVKFTDEPRETIIPDISAHLDTVNKMITSVTNELSWVYGQNDYFTINTAGTKGIVGFIPDKKIMLGDWELQSDNRFAVILITSLNKDKNLKDADKILITTVARGKNSGMKYNPTGDSLISVGTYPLLLEPVNVNLSINGESEYTVEVLDHDGLPTGKFVPVKNGKSAIKGSESKTLWYLLEK